MQLVHLTLNTRHVLRITPDHITQQTRSILAGIIDQGNAPIPGFPEWQVNITREQGQASFDIRHRGELCFFNVVVWDDQKASAAWRMLHGPFASFTKQMESQQKEVRQPASVPWLATWILPSVVFCQGLDVRWVADFEQCLAFSLIENGTV